MVKQWLNDDNNDNDDAAAADDYNKNYNSFLKQGYSCGIKWLVLLWQCTFCFQLAITIGLIIMSYKNTIRTKLLWNLTLYKDINVTDNI